MNLQVCACEYGGNFEYHIRYPGMTEQEAHNLVHNINSSMLSLSATRDRIITDMCYTWNHEYGLVKDPESSSVLDGGLTPQEREGLRRNMTQLFDNCIAPYIKDFRSEN